MLNPANATVRRDMYDVYQLHRTVQSAFPDGLNQRSALFRLDKIGPNRTQLLVQSAIKPAWNLPGDYASEIGVKEFSPSFAQDSTYRFRLSANPVTVDHGRRKPIRDVNGQMAWLARQAQQAGFHIFSAEPRSAKLYLGTKVTQVADKTKVDNITVYTVVFEGYLRVLDPGLFLEKLSTGIGRARALGCGLISVASMDWGIA